MTWNGREHALVKRIDRRRGDDEGVGLMEEADDSDAHRGYVVRAMITLSQMPESLYSAAVCDVLDALGYTRQSPRVLLRRTSGGSAMGVLIGGARRRCGRTS
jgi:hypothetical protein